MAKRHFVISATALTALGGLGITAAWMNHEKTSWEAARVAVTSDSNTPFATDAKSGAKLLFTSGSVKQAGRDSIDVAEEPQNSEARQKLAAAMASAEKSAVRDSFAQHYAQFPARKAEGLTDYHRGTGRIREMASEGCALFNPSAETNILMIPAEKMDAVSLQNFSSIGSGARKPVGLFIFSDYEIYAAKDGSLMLRASATRMDETQTKGLEAKNANAFNRLQNGTKQLAMEAGTQYFDWLDTLQDLPQNRTSIHTSTMNGEYISIQDAGGGQLEVDVKTLAPFDKSVDLGNPASLPPNLRDILLDTFIIDRAQIKPGRAKGEYIVEAPLYRPANVTMALEVVSRAAEDRAHYTFNAFYFDREKATIFNHINPRLEYWTNATRHEVSLQDVVDGKAVIPEGVAVSIKSQQRQLQPFVGTPSQDRAKAEIASRAQKTK